VKKFNQNTDLINKDFNLDGKSEKSQIKTTDVNILLNRVRLDKKKALKKRIIFLLFFATAISSLTVYLIN
tara:strand:- start:66 stop:275 length:210 start_codon:yes stop_codon:yes gene_type:complete